MVQSLTPAEAQELMSRRPLDVVDVREPNEWAGGHLRGARLVPLAQLRAGPRDLLPRDGIIFVCAAGVRSDAAARLAASLGYREVYNLSGGTRRWAAAGLPLVCDAPAPDLRSEAAAAGALGL